MYRLFRDPEYGVREAALDEWSDAIDAALRRPLLNLCENPLAGDALDPLKGEFVARIPILNGRLVVELLYRVDNLRADGAAAGRVAG